MSAVSASVSASASNTTSQNPNSIFGSGTTINFGSGQIYQPSELNVTPNNSTTSEPVTTATAAQGSAGSDVRAGGAGGGSVIPGTISTQTLLIVGASVSVLALLLVVAFELRRK